MIEEEALLRAIRNNPEEDTPRLVYADWLDENPKPVGCAFCDGTGYLLGSAGDKGNPRCSCNLFDSEARAAFIRVQVALAADPKCKACDGTGRLDADHRPGTIECRACQPWGSGKRGPNDPLRKREAELWDDRRNVEWFPLPDGVALELGTPPAQAPSTAFVTRGFVSAITCSVATFFGGRCGRCGGTGERNDYESQLNRICPLCHGRRRFDGVVADIFRWNPIEQVTLNDHGLVWKHTDDTWRAGSGGTPSVFLHIPVWEMFCDSGPHYTEDATREALSAACVAYGRSLVKEDV